MSKKDEIICFRLEEAIKEELTRIANIEDRSISQVVCMLVLDALIARRERLNSDEALKIRAQKVAQFKEALSL